ncbi:nitroreductase/quinone reductase family protein [Terrabacter ginsenosidimutans]|uniref:Nitroreductase/quinone reductase family protein n=2 Tax=Terrabacter ginsenosidimutans TaxID=490575 RepID=A0ABP7DHQ9_9MICO
MTDGFYAAAMRLRSVDEANPVQRALRGFVASRPGAWVSKRVLHRLDRLGHRLAPGRALPSQRLAAVPVGMLTTTGARSGQPRTVPLMLAPLEEGWGVIASHYGSERPPAWYFNLRAHPGATLEVDGIVHRVRAVQVQGPDRERVREAALGFYRGYTAYEQRAGGRDLGFFVLHPERD